MERIMDNEILVIGDLHLRGDKFWKPVYKKFFDQLENVVEDIRPKRVIQLGDFFHTSSPDVFEYLDGIEALDFLSNNSYYGTTILSGNHDFSIKNDVSAIQILEHTSVKTHCTISCEKIDNMLFFPWLPVHKRQEYIQSLEQHHKDIDVIFYHFTDETQAFGTPVFNFTEAFTALNIPLDSIKLIGGDIHIPSSRYVGSVFPTNFGEIEVRGNFHVYSEDFSTLRKIPIDPAIEFIDVNCGDKIPEKNESTVVRQIRLNNVESIAEAKSIYKENLEDISQYVPPKQLAEENVDSSVLKPELSIKEYFEIFVEQFNVPVGVSDKIKPLLC